MTTIDTATELVGSCTRESCTAPTGPCEQGFADVEVCPDFGVIEHEEQEDDATLDEDDPRGSDQVSLPDGLTLTTDDASAVLAASPSTVVALLGAVAAGKTTLLTAIYESYIRGPFADHIFAGSRTLVGWEQRCHPSRIASGRRSASTNRTAHGNPRRLLDLELAPRGTPTSRSHILLTDIAGEAFDELRDHPSSAAALSLLVRADRIALALDGEILANHKTRHRPAGELKQVIRGLIEVSGLHRAAAIDLVATKWDVVHSAGKQVEVNAFLEGIVTDIATVAAPAELQVVSHLTAARSKPDDGLTPGFGIEDLTKHWLKIRKRVPIELATTTAQRPYDRYRAPTDD